MMKSQERLPEPGPGLQAVAGVNDSNSEVLVGEVPDLDRILAVGWESGVASLSKHCYTMQIL